MRASGIWPKPGFRAVWGLGVIIGFRVFVWAGSREAIIGFLFRISEFLTRVLGCVGSAQSSSEMHACQALRCSICSGPGLRLLSVFALICCSCLFTQLVCACVCR